MIKISLRHKVALELYASLSFLAAIVTFIYSIIYNFFGDNLFIPAGIIGIFLIAFIYSMRTLIMDVNSAKFETDESVDEPEIVEMKIFNKVTLELISSISNVIIISIIFIFGLENTGRNDSESILVAFILILLLPLIFLVRSLIFDLNLIFMNKKHRENFTNEIITRRNIVFFFIVLIILFSAYITGKLGESVSDLYGKSISKGEETIHEMSSNIYVNSIMGERNEIPGGPVTSLNIYIEASKIDINVNYILIKYISKSNTSELRYGIEADASHFYYEGKTTGKGNPKLRKEDTGVMTINLSATKQELHSFESGTIQMILGAGKTISKDIKAPQLDGESRIMLYPATWR